MPTADLNFNKITVRQLAFSDDLSFFKCDQDDRLGCDDFIHNEDEAKLFQKERHGITYLFSYEGNVIGYVTLAMSSIPAKRMDKRSKELVSLKSYPSLLIGRLAVGNNWRRKGVGRYLCDWCLGIAMALSEKVGCRYVIVETDQNNVNFYENCDFKLGKELEEDKGKAMWMYQRITLE
jgi:predicted GNAT family N-acyltransferase